MNRLSNPEQDVADVFSHGKSFFPYPDEVFVHSMFPQMWGDSSMGFGGVGGQAITTAYTIILSDNRMFAIYFGGRFAYSVVRPTELFFSDIQERMIAPDSASSIYVDLSDPHSSITSYRSQKPDHEQNV